MKCHDLNFTVLASLAQSCVCAYFHFQKIVRFGKNECWGSGKTDNMNAVSANDLISLAIFSKSSFRAP